MGSGGQSLKRGGTQKAKATPIPEMKPGDRVFHIEDIDSYITVEQETRKNLLDYMDEYIDNLQYDWFDGSDTSYEIVYDDGSRRLIYEDYDGGRIKKTGILSIVENNAETARVYGPFSVNEYGVVTAEYNEEISDLNIKEIPNPNKKKRRRR